MDKNEVLRSYASRAKRKLRGVEKSAKAKIRLIKRDDSAFKEKVEYLVSKEDEIFNPIHYLVDEKVMKTLKEDALERYIFDIVERYKNIREDIKQHEIVI